MEFVRLQNIFMDIVRLLRLMVTRTASSYLQANVDFIFPQKGPAGLAVKLLDLHLVNVGSIPTGPTHGEGRLQPHPGDVLRSTPHVRKSPRSGLNLEGRLSDPQITVLTGRSIAFDLASVELGCNLEKCLNPNARRILRSELNLEGMAEQSTHRIQTCD